MRKLLLISSSRVHGKDFLEHAAKDLRKHFNGKSVLFVPYALAEHESTTDTVRRHFKEFGLDLVGMHEAADPRQAILEAEGIYVGGGNTFRLLATLQELGLLAVIARRVRAGMPYAGASAGSNLACPTLMTTNDMPIVEPRSFEALGLVRFQPYVLPSRNLFSSEDSFDRAAGPARWNAQQGLYIYRSNRMVQAGGWCRKHDGSQLLPGRRLEEADCVVERVAPARNHGRDRHHALPSFGEVRADHVSVVKTVGL